MDAGKTHCALKTSCHVFLLKLKFFFSFRNNHFATLLFESFSFLFLNNRPERSEDWQSLTWVDPFVDIAQLSTTLWSLRRLKCHQAIKKKKKKKKRSYIYKNNFVYQMFFCSPSMYGESVPLWSSNWSIFHDETAGRKLEALVVANVQLRTFKEMREKKWRWNLETSQVGAMRLERDERQMKRVYE